MFNYNLYEKKLRKQNEVNKAKDEFIRSYSSHKEKQNQLALNYKKRVENFVVNMLEKPIINQECTGLTEYKIRDEFPEKFLRDNRSTKRGLRKEKEKERMREKEQLEKNQDRDYMPNLTVTHHQFRERDTQKEIQPDMRFTAKTSLERIEQLLKDHMQTQVEILEMQRINRRTSLSTFLKMLHFGSTPISSIELFMFSQNRRRRLVSKQIAKNLLPSLHNKTHFSATQSLFNNCPLSLSEKVMRSSISAGNQGKDEPLVDEQEKQDIPIIKSQSQKGLRVKQPIDGLTSKLTRNNSIEAFNPVEVSKNVLEKCNVIKKKSTKVKHVGMGTGHLISTLNKSISEVYHDLYNKEIQFPTTFS